MAIAHRAPAALGTGARRLLRARTPLSWLQVALILTLLAALPLARNVDPDFWWHLRTGDLIVHGGIPRRDPYSWTAAGSAWSAHEWLSEVVIYLVQSTLGYAGGVALFGGAAAAAVATMCALGRRFGVGRRTLVLLVLFGALLLAPFVTVRPQVFTWLLFASAVFVLERHEAGERMPIWALPPLLAVWANLHLGFVYGLMAVGLWFAARVIDKVKGSAVELRGPALLMVACTVATFLNPSGPEILVYPLRYVQDAGSLRVVNEWRRPDPLNPFMAPYLLAMVLTSIALLSKHRPRPFLLLLSVAVIALSLQAVRNLPFVALLMIPVVGGVAGRRWAAASTGADSRASMSLPVGLAVLSLFLLGMVAAGVRQHGTLWKPNEDGYPRAGTDYVQAHLGERKLFNQYAWGGYLIFKLYPGGRVFIDGRTDFYRGALLDDYTWVSEAKPGWDERLERYGVEAALVRKDKRLASALREDADWREVFTGPVESVFVRNEGAVGQ